MDPSDETGQQSTPQPPVPPVPFPAVPQAPSAAADSQQPAQPDAQPMTLPLPPNPTQNGGQTLAQIDVTPTTQMAAPPVIDDGDLIEKEWVQRANQIVARTRNDPYKQSEELAALRADYMQKRYNKTIKLNT